MSELRELRCPDCRHLLCKVAGEDYEIEIVCTGACRKLKRARVKSFRYPHPLATDISPLAARALKTAADPERT